MVDFYRAFHDRHPDENGIIVADDGVSEYAYVANTGLWHREPLAGRIVLFGDEHYDRVRIGPEEVYERIGQCRPIWNQGFGAKVLRVRRLQPDAEKRTSADLGLDPARVPPLADDAWRRLPLVDDDPSPEYVSVADIWEQESEGLEWCDCGHRPLTVEPLMAIAEEVITVPVPQHLRHDDVAAILKELWGLRTVCHYFRMALETAALRVNVTVDASYELPVALAIAKDFSDRWDGCPDEELAKMRNLRDGH
ncbi:hypothetical protein [Brachybacterium alimentarium]|uniref:Uncharacterized protein n=1 Tax=Brachybacterium alimentarium TaxID=47845 RepID=A0A2A3YE77_9MICO|nr:hypothetical protein [Brachybacterium alimentarium]PCC37559.1 hypothetical protein CIK66_18690 [Brachybacterium alimentarium]